jgi:TonB family protein
MPQPLVMPSPRDDQGQQRKRMLIALGVLLFALLAVVVKDWDFWFPPNPESQDATYVPSPAKTATTPAKPPVVLERKPVKPAEHPAVAAPPLTAKAERTVLPEMAVEVVAGNRHTKVPARSNAIHVDVGEGAAAPVSQTAPPLAQLSIPAAPAAAPPAPAAAPPTQAAAPPTQAAAPPAPVAKAVNAAPRVALSQQATQSVTKSVPPDYPLLARQMRVQGAVVLQALISREGTIQELQVLSGPSILATAAQEAVKQWRFKPYFLNGQAVETQAKITVNFTISTN